MRSGGARSRTGSGGPRARAARSPCVSAGAAVPDHELCGEVEALRAASLDVAGVCVRWNRPHCRPRGIPPPCPPTPTADTVAPQHGTGPRRFGDYEVLGEIARGGMGIRLRAGRYCSIALWRLKTVVGGVGIAALWSGFTPRLKEMANLAHPNIVPIYEIGEHEGSTTSDALSRAAASNRRSPAYALPDPRAGRLSLSRTAAARQAHIARLVATVARAVHHAHRRGGATVT